MDMKQHPLYGLIKAMSVEAFDAEAYAQSESFAGIIRNQEVMKFMNDEGGQEARDYWLAKGLIKELHDAQTQPTKWASYIPVSSKNDPDRRYPLVFVMHGSNNPILLAESYGYANIAAREELILIIPEDETPENVDKLFKYAFENYPVDPAQVYMVGYSLGGYMTLRHALRWPERFAAVGSGGMLFANGHAIPAEQGGKLWPGEDITPDMVLRAAEFGIPACVCMGEDEILGLIPVTRDEPVDKRINADAKPGERIDLSSKNKIRSINNLRIANGCKAVDETDVRKAVEAASDTVTQKLGFPFDRTEVITRENRAHYVGDSIDAEGRCRLRLIGLEHSPHWPSQALCELTWEFISRFRLDPKTGKSFEA